MQSREVDNSLLSSQLCLAKLRLHFTKPRQEDLMQGPDPAGNALLARVSIYLRACYYFNLGSRLSTVQTSLQLAAVWHSRLPLQRARW